MTTNGASSIRDPAAQAASLRAELKDWERAFAAANEGEKAGRDDIKKNPEIGICHSIFINVLSGLPLTT